MSGTENVSGNGVPGLRKELGSRIREAIKYLGYEACVRATGRSARTLDRYVAGEVEPPLSVITGLSDATGWSLRWLATGDGNLSSTGITPNAESSLIAHNETVAVPRLDVRASAGHGAAASKEYPVDFVPFPASWIKAKGLNPASLRIVDVMGDSMEPTLASGDIILVDTAVKRIRGEALYVVIRDDDVYVKRAQKRMNGTLLIASDNERYPPEELTEKDAEKLHVAGRVVWFGRSI